MSFAAQGSRVRRADRPRDRQAAVGSADRGRRGRQQGRDLGRGLCRANAAAEDGSRARQPHRRPPQAARRARRARALQFPGAPAQRPHRPGADRRQRRRVQAVGEDAGDRRVPGRLLPRGGHSRRRRPAARSAGPNRARRSPAQPGIDGLLFTGSARAGDVASPPVRRNAAEDPRARAGRQQSAGRLGRARTSTPRRRSRPVGLSHRRPALHRGAAADRRGRPRRPAARRRSAS